MMKKTRCTAWLLSLLIETAVIGMLMKVSAFSPPGPRTDRTRRTERNFGQVDQDVSVTISSTVPSLIYPDVTLDMGNATSPSDFDLLRKSSGKVAAKSRKRRTKPRSLNSKIESSNVVESKYPDLLSQDEESTLTNSIREMRRAIRTREDLVASHPNPEGTEIPWEPSETEWAVACDMSVTQLQTVMHEGVDAREKLITANGGLVRSIAKKHYYAMKQANQAGMGSILTLQDLVQEGTLGLMEAAERFEPERGFRFSTYATYWVRQRILRSISDSSRVIRLPAHVQSTLNKISRAKKELKKDGRNPTLVELADYLEMSVDKLRLYTDASRSVLSLEMPMNPGDSKGEDKRTLGDRIASNSPTPEQDVVADSLRQDIRDVVNDLPPRERDVLVTRFGLEDGTPRTVAETSKRLGISRERVRLAEGRALNKLRHPMRKYKLKDYVGENEISSESNDDFY